MLLLYLAFILSENKSKIEFKNNKLYIRQNNSVFIFMKYVHEINCIRGIPILVISSQGNIGIFFLQ